MRRQCSRTVKLSEGWAKLEVSKFLLPVITELFFTSLGGCTLSGGEGFLSTGVRATGVVSLAAGFD